MGADLRNRVVAIRTTEASDREAKKPWKGQCLTGRTEGDFLYQTAISRNIIPFALVAPPLVILPVLTTIDSRDNKVFEVLDAEGLSERGYRYASTWFFEAEQRWDAKKTDNNKAQGTTLSDYLDWQSKLSQQDPDARFLVLYTSSATDACAVVVDRKKFDHPFVVDHKAYWCICKTEAEAHYVCAYINSGYANKKIKDFQSRGLFGPRDIHKLIVKVPFPTYERSEAIHVALAHLGKQCADLAERFVQTANVEDLQSRALGVIRSRLKAQMASELIEIDKIVEKLSTGKVAPERSKRRRSRRGNGGGSLL